LSSQKIHYHIPSDYFFSPCPMQSAPEMTEQAEEEKLIDADEILRQYKVTVQRPSENYTRKVADLLKLRI
jgi:hypothetical protein